MKTVVALCLAGAAALTFSSCTCPACMGSGVQVASEAGIDPWTGKKYGRNATITCVRCKGKGTNIGDIMDGIRTVNEVAGTVNNINHTVRAID